MEKKVAIFTDFGKAEQADKDWYHALTPHRRLQILEEMRQMYYEDNASGFPRVLEVIERTRD